MVSIGALGLSAIVVLTYISGVVSVDECPTVSRGKLDVCVATFSTSNLDNRSDRKARIDAGNNTCPTDILKDSCTSYNVMIGCVNLAGFPSGCEAEFNRELSNQDFKCTYEELAALCPDADKISGAPGVLVSLSLVGACVFAAIFNRL